MFVGEFQPADEAESEVFAFDFRRDLAPGEALTAVQFQLSVIDGTDATVASRLIGPAIVSGTQARQRIGTLVDGVTYKVQAIVSTTQGNTKSLWGRVTCKG